MDKTIQAICTLSNEEIRAVRADLFRILGCEDAPTHVKDGAVAMLNYYGAVIDLRMKAVLEPF